MEFSKPGKNYAIAMWSIVGINAVLCFFIIGLFALIPIGAWQVLDAIARVLQGDRRRVNYLKVVAVYFLIIGLAYLEPNVEIPVIIGYMFVLPNFIALWYCYITHAHANETTTQPAEDKELSENILDADIF